jgi:hypothetical protein
MVRHRKKDPDGVASTKLKNPPNFRFFTTVGLHHVQQFAHGHRLSGRSNRAVYDLAALGKANDR